MPSAASLAAANAVAGLITPAPSQAAILAVAATLDGPLPLGAVQTAADNVATLTNNTIALFTTEPDGGAHGDGMVNIRGVDGVGVPVPSYKKAVAQVDANTLDLAAKADTALSNLSNASAARAHLGLGSAATHGVSDFADAVSTAAALLAHGEAIADKLDSSDLSGSMLSVTEAATVADRTASADAFMVSGGVTKRAAVSGFMVSLLGASSTGAMSTLSGVSFPATGAPSGAGLADRFAAVVNLQNDHGAVLDNVTDCTAALNAAIARAATSTFPLAIYVPGFAKINTDLLNPITAPVVLFSDTPRRGCLQLTGSKGLRFGQGVSRVPNSGLRHIQVGSSLMTGTNNVDPTLAGFAPDGFAINADWTEGFTLKDVVLANPWNGIYLRQCGAPEIDIPIIDGVRGYRGLFAYGSGTTRNGELDKIDVLAIPGSTTIQGTYTPFVTAPGSAIGLVIDGYVQTIEVGALRVLNAYGGIRTANSPNLSAQTAIGFLTARTLQTENTSIEGMGFYAGKNLNIDNVFASTSVQKMGVYVGPTVRLATLGMNGGRVVNNGMMGIDLDAAKNVRVGPLAIYGNSQSASGSYDGVVIGSGDDVVFFGTNVGQSDYSEFASATQRYGINNAGAGNVRCIGCDAAGNITGGYNGIPAANLIGCI